MEDAERMLKELVYNHWRKDGCEGYDDTLRFTSAIDFFIPFFPLQKPQVHILHPGRWVSFQAGAPFLDRTWQQPRFWRRKFDLLGQLKYVI